LSSDHISCLTSGSNNIDGLHIFDLGGYIMVNLVFCVDLFFAELIIYTLVRFSSTQITLLKGRCRCHRNILDFVVGMAYFIRLNNIACYLAHNTDIHQKSRRTRVSLSVNIIALKTIHIHIYFPHHVCCSCLTQ
jgi:hypothetical protein